MLITVFTPAYNRANLLPRVYESLQSQTYKDFEWIVVDDGSTDNTEEVVSGFMSQASDFDIRYIKKQNGGKHTAVNIGVQIAKGELFFNLDSDDYLPENSLQIVVDEYMKISGDESYAGVAGLDMYANGNTVSQNLPMNTINCNAIDIRYKFHITGDMKEVYRTAVMREFPFPEIEGERFSPEQLVWFRIAQKYKLHYFNKPIYIAEYQEGGITAGITKARMNSPIATMMCYAELTRYDVPFMQKMKAAINYWRFRFCAHGGVMPTVNPLWSVVMPIAYMMHLRDCKS